VTDHEDGPPNEQPPPPSFTEEPKTSPEASPRALTPSSMPPSPHSDYFERVLRDLKTIHGQQMSAFAELHDPESRLNKNIELVLFEVRGVRRDFASIALRTGKLEERMDEVERELAREKTARIRLEEGLVQLEAKLDAAIAASVLRAPVTG
jgi:hypothetical protein